MSRSCSQNGGRWGAFKILTNTPTGKRPSGRPRRGWEDNNINNKYNNDDFPNQIWAGYVARMQEGRSAFKIVTGKPTGNS